MKNRIEKYNGKFQYFENLVEFNSKVCQIKITFDGCSKEEEFFISTVLVYILLVEGEPYTTSSELEINVNVEKYYKNNYSIECISYNNLFDAHIKGDGYAVKTDDSFDFLCLRMMEDRKFKYHYEIKLEQLKKESVLLLINKKNMLNEKVIESFVIPSVSSIEKIELPKFNNKSKQKLKQKLKKYMEGIC